MEERRQICLVLEYDGSAYHGWQWQDNNLSIQEVIEGAVGKITGEPSRVIGSGRTDAGVHALGQVATFLTRFPMPAADFTRALNAVLPRDIRVLSSIQAAPDFHPQFSAKGKSYLYVVLNRPEPSALLVNRAWHVRKPLAAEEMLRAACMLTGEHDFSSFQSSACVARDPVRTLSRLEIVAKGRLVEFRFDGNGFLKNMVRNIIGTLVDVGLGLYPAGRIGEILAARDRRQAGPCAPAKGLYLVSVKY